MEDEREKETAEEIQKLPKREFTMITENEYRAYLDGLIQGNYKRCEEIVPDILSRKLNR